MSDLHPIPVDRTLALLNAITAAGATLLHLHADANWPREPLVQAWITDPSHLPAIAAQMGLTVSDPQRSLHNRHETTTTAWATDDVWRVRVSATVRAAADAGEGSGRGGAG